MGKRSARLWWAVLTVLAWGGIIALCPAHGAAQSYPMAPPSKSFTSTVRDGFDKFTDAIAPKKTPAQAEPPNDAVSLKSQAKAGVGLYVAVARLYEQSGRLAEAEHNYQLALKEKPDDLAALLGYARLKEQLGKPDDAVKLYQRAATAYPNEAGVLNNLGLCYARDGKLDEAVGTLGRAISLQPKNPLYRNNIATVLVEMGRMQEAFSHLDAVHSDAAAYYNLGYLLVKKGKKQEAVQHFVVALRLDPSLGQAKSWLDQLQASSDPPTPARPPQRRLDDPILVGSRPMPPAQQTDPGATTPAGVPTRKHLPPRPSAAEGAMGRGLSSSPSETPPMPPDLATPTRLPPTELRGPLGAETGAPPGRGN